jgi:hypothetical protein
MQREEGNLTTGIYVAICNLNKDDSVAKVEAQGNGYRILGTKDRNDENAEVRTIPTPAGTFFFILIFSSGILKAWGIAVIGVTTRNLGRPSYLQPTLRVLSLIKRS